MSADVKTAERHEMHETRKTGFGAKATETDKHLPGNSQERLDEKLDDAIEETFPSSDPVSVKITK